MAADEQDYRVELFDAWKKEHSLEKSFVTYDILMKLYCQAPKWIDNVTGAIDMLLNLLLWYGIDEESRMIRNAKSVLNFSYVAYLPQVGDAFVSSRLLPARDLRRLCRTEGRDSKWIRDNTHDLFLVIDKKNTDISKGLLEFKYKKEV